MIGGIGADTIYFHFGNGILSSGHDILRDTPVDLNGDQVWGFGSGYTSAVDVRGVQFGQISLVVADSHQSATVSSEGSTATLNGQFTNGQFMVDTRGSGDQEHTTVSFVQFMPTLTEGKAVSSGALNGVANQPFLTGDGSVRFTLTFNQAISSFDNTLGYYQVSADGTIHDVRLLFTNTHAVAAGQTVDLGVPSTDERIGFFLVQNGFDKYGTLPNDLYFLSPATHLSANLNSSSTPVLLSQSQGTLTAAQIFHSFNSLNAGGAPQVLSGVLPGGHDLQDRLRGPAERQGRQRLPGRCRQHSRLARLSDRLKAGSRYSLLSRRACAAICSACRSRSASTSSGAGYRDAQSRFCGRPVKRTVRGIARKIAGFQGLEQADHKEHLDHVERHRRSERANLQHAEGRPLWRALQLGGPRPQCARS